MKRCPECEYKTRGPETTCPKCGELLLMIHGENRTGTTLESKYQILRKIGKGGMGVVYEAEQISLKRRVAIKFLRSQFCDDPEIVRRFLREAQAAARLSHVNIVTVHDFSQTADGILYIAMEFLEKGRDLKAEIREKGKLSLEETVLILQEICLALAHAHERNVIHRDIKPENIFLQEKGDRRIAKILDFGIAKIYGGKTQTIRGMVAGTPEYMSPEQLRGEQVDARSDLYSLACVLYECLTGKPPFMGKTPTEIAMMHLNAVPASVTNANQDMSEDINHFFEKALAKRPEERFASAQEMYEVFSRVAKERVAQTILIHQQDMGVDRPLLKNKHSYVWVGGLAVGTLGLLIALNFLVNLPIVTDEEKTRMATDVSEVKSADVDAETSVFPGTMSWRADFFDQVQEWLRKKSVPNPPKLITEHASDDFIIMEPEMPQISVRPKITLDTFVPVEIKYPAYNVPETFAPLIDAKAMRRKLQKEFEPAARPIHNRKEEDKEDEEDMFKVKKY